jgi:predicted RNA-binding Zn-ribbon protein involved in translation (DUF1610 family)
MTFLAEIQPRDKKDESRTPNQEDESEDGEIVFDQNPVKVVCPHCGLSVITFIEHESSWVTYLAAMVMLMTLGWAALCVVPIVFPLFKDVVHHCPRCLNVLATRSRVAISGMKSEVMSLRFGSCVIVLARKWVILLVGLTCLIGGVHTMRSRGSGMANPGDVPTRSEPAPLGWEDFSKDCGFKSYLGNPIHVTMSFAEKYKAKTFRWQGKVHHVEEGFRFLWWSQSGAVFAKMQPPQFTNKREVPDLVLIYDESTEKLAKEASKLRKDQQFGFEASMVEVGRRGAPHTMVLWELFPDGNGTSATAKV